MSCHVCFHSIRQGLVHIQQSESNGTHLHRCFVPWDSVHFPSVRWQYKMAVGRVLLDSCLEQFSCNQAYHDVYKCANCVSMESRLKDALLELSSSQFIIKL